MNQEDPAANWAFLRENGYDFSIDDFKQAQKAVYEEHGTDALPYAEIRRKGRALRSKRAAKAVPARHPWHP